MASTALSATGLILACACLSVIPGPVMPRVTGFLYLTASSVRDLATTFAMSSSCFVSPFITAPSVTTASISFFVIMRQLQLAYRISQ